MTLELNSATGKFYNIICLNCLNAKIFMLAEDTGFFATPIQTAVTDNSLRACELT